MFLDERAALHSPEHNGEPDDSNAGERLFAWQKNAAKNEEEAFERWVDWRNLNVRSPETILVSSVTPSELPEWAVFLEEVLDRYDEEPDHRLYSSGEPVPFEILFHPFAAAAKDQLYRQVKRSAMTELSDDLLFKMLRKLVKVLSRNSAGVFHQCFRGFRSRRHPELMISMLTGMETKLEDHKKAEQSDVDYQAFTEKLRDGEIVHLFEEFSAAARILSTITLQWIDAMAEFIRRLHADHSLIAETFFEGTDPGTLTDIEANFSDRHQNGRCVMQLTFEESRRLVYKPREMRVDSVYSDLLQWLNTRSGFDYFTPVKTLPCDGYGWAEFIEQQPCENENEARDYFRRAGGLLALSYVLKSADLHEQNIIAHGSRTVIVDMETVIQPTMPSNRSVGGENDDEPAGLLLSDFAYSVLRTGLLPTWHKSPHGKSVDVSGLGAEPVSKKQWVKWVYINTDGMTRENRDVVPDENKNVPYLHDTYLDAGDYVAEIEAGFREVYQLILEERDRWLNPKGPLHDFTNLPLRFVYRNTDIYAAILHASIQPPVLKEGIDRSLKIELLARPYLFVDSQNGKPETWPLFEQERSALERLDIPMFTVYTGSTDLLAAPETPVPGFFEKSAIDSIHDHLHRLCEPDLELQCRLLRASFFARKTPDVETIIRDASPVKNPDQIPDNNLFIDEATNLAKEILNAALRFDNGRREWMTLTMNPYTEQLTPSLARFNMYDGKTGILCAVAAIAHATDDESMMKAVRQCIHGFCDELERMKRLPTGYPVGGVSGAGSIVYGLLNLARWTNSERVMRTAKTVGSRIDSSHFEKDEMLDVMSGSAGALLALLAMYEVTDDEYYLGQARKAGMHLLDTRVKDEPTGLRVWPFPHDSNRPLTGFSHGAAGIAYSLLKLDSFLNEPQHGFRAAAKEALAYERSVFIEDQCNWPDFRKQQASTPADEPVCMTAWCHGAAGIGLSRALMLPYLPDDTQLPKEIATAVDTTRNYPLNAQDHLCCGNFGRIGIMHEIAQITDHPGWDEAARKTAGACINRAHKDGEYLFSIPQKGDCPNVSLFRGIGGVAYTLLRLAKPGEYPSLLSMEAPG